MINDACYKILFKYVDSEGGRMLFMLDRSRDMQTYIFVL